MTNKRHHSPLLGVGMLFESAYRSVLAGGWKSTIVAGIVCIATGLVVAGSAFLHSTVDAMRQSITGSITGDLQVYSSESKDQIDVLGGLDYSINLTPLADYGAVARALRDVPGVAALVPMALDAGLVSIEGRLDRKLGALRATLATLAGQRTSATLKRYETQKAEIKQMVLALHRELQHTERSVSTKPVDLAAIELAVRESFWAQFDRDPYDSLEWLENRVATQAADSDSTPLRYLGTDPAAFARAFDRFQIVDGSALEPGERGFMFSQSSYEERFKLRTAHRLDQLKRARDMFGGSIATDPQQASLVRQNASELREIMLQLDAAKSDLFRSKLQRFLSTSDDELHGLLARFFAMSDGNFQERYSFFYRELAPELELYRVKIGDDIRIHAFSRTGYMRSAKLKLKGTYRLAGLDDVPQAGTVNLIDLLSFRELHGLSASADDVDLVALRSAAALHEVSRSNAESALFAEKQVGYDAPTIQPRALPDMRGLREQRERAWRAGYDPAEIDAGPVTSIAVVLQGGAELEDTARAIEEAGRLAGLPLRAAVWHQAAGMLGQFAALMRVVLLVGALVIFGVALLVISNALLMAALDRVRELGTLRALGAQPELVLCKLVLESILLCGTAGLTGAAVGALSMTILHGRGIPAGSEVMAFVFGGPRLYPSFGAQELALALAAALAISLLSAIFPAWLAARVSPREAMHADE